MSIFARLLRKLAATHPNLLAVAFGCFLVTALLVGAECFFRTRAWLLTPSGERPVHSNFLDMAEPAPRLGYRAKPSASLTEHASRSDQLIYSASYHTDADSFRVTPVANLAGRECAAVFLGCSITFGMGVDDPETLPAQFAEIATGYRPINAGFPGYGPQQVWLQLSDAAFLAKIPGERGIVIYTHIDDHLNRLAGTPAVLSGWDYPLPWLLEEEGTIQWRGTFADRDPLQYYLYRYGGRLHIYRFLANRFRHTAPVADMNSGSENFIAHVIEDAAAQLASQRPAFQLYVLLMPGSRSRLPELLQASEVKCLDYSRLLEGTEIPMEELWYRDSPNGGWGHPRAKLYGLVAAQLAKDVPPCEPARGRD